jgi:UPF0176 protein
MTAGCHVITVATFYKFVALDNISWHRSVLLPICKQLSVKGTVLLAPEGINGTLAGSPQSVDSILAHLRDKLCQGVLESRLSGAHTMPFGKLKIRLKKEIVTMGIPDIDPSQSVGAYVSPACWNGLINNPDVVLIDTRNSFEVAQGTFENALNPGTQSFGQFPAWFDLASGAFTGKKIAMFCTGGIRCEKATAYALSKGFTDVVHLHGGILKYLETIPEQDSLWQGDCFVFDQRVAVRHELEIADGDPIPGLV